MSYRFWRRLKIAPGVTLNLSKSGGSLSFGPRGGTYTLSPRGRRATLGIPGTGLFYTTTTPGRPPSRRRPRSQSAAAPRVPPRHRLSLGFFKRLLTPAGERALLDGCLELARGHEDAALEHLRKATHLADGAYLAGFLYLKKGHLPEAARCLTLAGRKAGRLGRRFSKYGISATMSLTITGEVSAHVGATLRGVLLGLAEVRQLQGKRPEAIECLQRLRRLEPDDVLVKVSLAELLLEPRSADKDALRSVVRLAEGAGNATPLHSALLLYKARALRRLGLLDAARDILGKALRRKAGRPADLVRALRYERALLYEQLGQHRRSRTEFEKLYAEAPSYADVAARLDL